MDKKNFFEPEVKVVVLDDANIICMSGEGGGDPIIDEGGGSDGDAD